MAVLCPLAMVPQCQLPKAEPAPLSLSPALPCCNGSSPFPPSFPCLICHRSHLNSLLREIIGPQVITSLQIITNRFSNRNELS